MSVLDDIVAGVRADLAERQTAVPERELRAWARKVRGWMGEGRDVHVYFDNDAHGDAPHNAVRLIALVSQHR